MPYSAKRIARPLAQSTSRDKNMKRVSYSDAKTRQGQKVDATCVQIAPKLAQRKAFPLASRYLLLPGEFSELRMLLNAFACGRGSARWMSLLSQTP